MKLTVRLFGIPVLTVNRVPDPEPADSPFPGDLTTTPIGFTQPPIPPMEDPGPSH